MQEQLFDVAIFDEASQIPLQNALGTIHRSKRILVAGDQQQMGPSSYFKAQSEEVVDLLHQASFYWKNVSLKHHYRSEHPELIRFSNKHFYGDELIAFPSAKTISQPINFHYCEDGIFDERKNSVEAKKVALLIEEALKSKEHLGIVAFSETQLTEIYSQLSSSAKALLENRLDEDSAFFKALENVQGEECDHLIISLGYGKNEAGEFHMRFGPLNTKNGPKRLNVLLTRAKKQVDFFASVKGSDFKISSNEAVDLLRLYLLQIETGEKQAREQEFPFELQPGIEGKTLIFDGVYSGIRSAAEMVTLVRVLEGRGWEVEFR
jgi:superfamily I DNA and/or RNA helicase